MLLLPEELRKLSLYLQSLGDFDQELIEHCSAPLERSDYTDTVKKAFLVLEKRLRLTVKSLPEIKGLSGHETAGLLMVHGFGEAGEGPLARKMGLDTKDAKYLRDLYRGAFGVFRNPGAHDLDAAYDSENARIVLLLVNMLLRQLKAIDSPDFLFKLLFAKQRISPQIQSLVREIVNQLKDIIRDLELNVGEKYIGLYSNQRSFASLAPTKLRLEIQCFTRGVPLPGTKVANAKIAPRWGRFSIKAKTQTPQAISNLQESQQRLVAAMLAGEPTGLYTGGSKPRAAPKV